MEKIAGKTKQDSEGCGVCGSHRKWSDGRCAACAEARADARKRQHIPGSIKPGYTRHNGKVIRKKDAKKRGTLPFSKGGPCTNCGNVEDRWKDGSCAPCRRQSSRNRYAKLKLDPEAYKKFLKRQAADAALRKEHELQLGVQTRREYQQEATPPWLSLEQIADIESLYYKARLLTRRSGESHVVDHIVPLKHPKVCGLHVPWNLRVVTAKENAKKKNAQFRDPDEFE